MHYDITLKDLFQQLPKQLFQTLWGALPVELLNLEFSQTKQRRPDIIAKLANGQIHHLELQSDNDADMQWRELEYYSLIYQAYQIEPIQQVLYVGNKPSRFTTTIQHKQLNFSYQLIDIRELDCLSLLESEEISDNILSLLGRLPDRREAVRRVLNKIAALTENHRNDVITRLAILSGLRPLELPNLLKEEVRTMSIRVNLMENPLFREGYEKRFEEGIQLGEQRGEQRGINKTTQQIARQMLAEGLPIALITKVTQLTAEEIQRLH
ncbi:Rpn family recombination-promoting nuclease/putative transposase [Beggiatoa leptomitoformis]|uniref:Rpn family recombination-promoting nuclease/putative transposase n=1 Tax=Beggiatoa leptomitoformis TaxID=288004 RepID=A0A2N9YEJ4_9GAMM|nr:Rpn family recombination-promoting nuclease/putative transposase [Beggiatoa leptomitoformis]ALG68727.1 Rpn family recombination-promoting nuclease/putative transposase [Beggiatoa leptomitoformis]AUI68918.1 Rpn family recombination-promoting nuclease/putative transposase [Beggiatoa leptomitoformis]